MLKHSIRLTAVLMMAGFIVAGMLGCNRIDAASSTPPASAPEAQTPAPPETVATLAKAAPPAEQSTATGESIAQAAMKKAAEANKHLFLFVSETDNEETATARLAFEAAASKLGDTAATAFIKRGSPAEKDVVEKFQLSRAPVPIVLALAPNGAITGAYLGEKLKDPQLQESIAGVGEQQCMKALQDQKLVFLCLQNSATKSNDAAMQGVNEFKADTRFAEFTEVVTVDPAAAADQGFLAKLQLDPQMTEATTAFIAPPGALIAKVSGATSKDALVAALMTASSGGCGSGGCGPKGCGPKK